jgi:hypothetical protein
MRELKYAPQLLGEVFYPGGAPISPENYSLEGSSARAVYFKIDEDGLDGDEFDFLKEYVIYYINAPFFEGLEEMTAKAENLKTPLELSEFIYELLDYGIDIF